MSQRKNILFMTSNGAGLGHLTRLMAVADHLKQDHNVVFFTLSRAAAITSSRGYPVEYLSSRRSGESTALWNRRLRKRVELLIEEYDIDGLVFDGTFPYNGLMQALAKLPLVKTVWMRRGMWKPGIGEHSIVTAERFNLVIEPGDFAEEVDVGLTTQHPSDNSIGPIVLQSREILNRTDARDELGIGHASTAVLLLLGAGQINDTESLTSEIVRDLQSRPETQIVLGHSVLSRQTIEPPPGVQVVSIYPISAYFAAFDFSVMASGYNSFHEALWYKLPTLFVPNMETKTDDQHARAKWAHDHGMARMYVEGQQAGLVDGLAQLADVATRRTMIDRMATLARDDGASQASELIAEMLA